MSDAPEFSRIVDLAKLGDGVQVEKIAATEAERAALSARFGLLKLDRLEADITLRRGRGRVRLQVDGHIRADATQACVVTLEPVPAKIDEKFSVAYGQIDDSKEIEMDPSLEGLEPLESDQVDIGEVVAQEFSLALDPYPRAPGAELPTGDGAPARESPFAALKKALK